MDKLFRLFQLWIVFILLINVESSAIRVPRGCGRSETFEIRHLDNPNSTIERFTTAYQGTLWNISYFFDSSYWLKLNLIFPNKPEDNVYLETPVNKYQHETSCAISERDYDYDHILFKCVPKQISQDLKGVELQLINLKPLTKEHSNFTLKLQTSDWLGDETTIHDECSVENIPVEEVTCDPPRTAPTNGDVSCTNTTQFGSICTYTCNEGYGLSNTSLSTTTCNGVGISTAGSWTSVPPQCIEDRTTTLCEEDMFGKLHEIMNIQLENKKMLDKCLNNCAEQKGKNKKLRKRNVELERRIREAQKILQGGDTETDGIMNDDSNSDGTEESNKSGPN